jgi:uncharacterized paraquat-inducible protein A
MRTENSITIDRHANLPLTTCPQCGMSWLTPGLSHGDTYECKNCRFSFVVRQAPKEISPAKNPS